MKNENAVKRHLAEALFELSVAHSLTLTSQIENTDDQGFKQNQIQNMCENYSSEDILTLIIDTTKGFGIDPITLFNKKMEQLERYLKSPNYTYPTNPYVPKYPEFYCKDKQSNPDDQYLTHPDNNMS